ncbi:hypothetical protein WN944_022885 [Citrus x changshan-huyou]|uniref:Uncharacterized protein n=1 Tax=Citrus x changshan-huyou TaxID=2935761 RepID=A0AAP0R0Q3_9ROSI
MELQAPVRKIAATDGIEGERLVELSGVPLESAAEMDLFDLADENEFALPYLNDEVHIE